uniref:Uncharacterized protein n=1 Tax=Noccaea caerulescens TaxID=107243 RepID=A0A1J3DYF0_NOCCA
MEWSLSSLPMRKQWFRPPSIMDGIDQMLEQLAEHKLTCSSARINSIVSPDCPMNCLQLCRTFTRTFHVVLKGLRSSSLVQNMEYWRRYLLVDRWRTYDATFMEGIEIYAVDLILGLDYFS